MPELPEVEILRKGLEPLLCGQTVARATLHRRDVAVGPDDPPGGFSRQRTPIAPIRLNATQLLLGAKIHGISRKGKVLAIVAVDGRTLGIHLGMSGQLLWDSGRAVIPTNHVHASWRFTDGSKLHFRDPRRFGGLWLADSPESLPIWKSLGPDALELHPMQLSELLAPVRRPIKAALIDQSLLAGVGNIYADEALHRAGVHPRTPACDIPQAGVVELGRSIVAILREAIEAGGSTVRDYRNAMGQSGDFQRAHQVYGRGGQPCTTCGTRLEQDTIGQRTSVWCPTCQPAEAFNKLSTTTRNRKDRKAGRSLSPKGSL